MRPLQVWCRYGARCSVTLSRLVSLVSLVSRTGSLAQTHYCSEFWLLLLNEWGHLSRSVFESKKKIYCHFMWSPDSDKFLGYLRLSLVLLAIDCCWCTQRMAWKLLRLKSKDHFLAETYQTKLIFYLKVFLIEALVLRTNQISELAASFRPGILEALKLVC